MLVPDANPTGLWVGTCPLFVNSTTRVHQSFLSPNTLISHMEDHSARPGPSTSLTALTRLDTTRNAATLDERPGSVETTVLPTICSGRRETFC